MEVYKRVADLIVAYETEDLEYEAKNGRPLFVIMEGQMCIDVETIFEELKEGMGVQ